MAGAAKALHPAKTLRHAKALHTVKALRPKKKSSPVGSLAVDISDIVSSRSVAQLMPDGAR